eukprot:COSAG04_NODE_2273_length_4414_cov_2.355968_2_plen_230_part_00
MPTVEAVSESDDEMEERLEGGAPGDPASKRVQVLAAVRHDVRNHPHAPLVVDLRGDDMFDNAVAIVSGTKNPADMTVKDWARLTDMPVKDVLAGMEQLVDGGQMVSGVHYIGHLRRNRHGRVLTRSSANKNLVLTAIGKHTLVAILPQHTQALYLNITFRIHERVVELAQKYAEFEKATLYNMGRRMALFGENRAEIVSIAGVAQKTAQGMMGSMGRKVYKEVRRGPFV